MSFLHQKQHIIKKTIEIIEQDGLSKLTLDKVSKSTGLSSNDISRIFKNIDNLVETVYKKTLKDEFVNSLKAINKLYGHDKCLYLHRILDSVYTGTTKHPRITKAHFYQSFVHDDRNTISASLLNSFIDQILLKILPNNCPSKLKKLTLVKLQQAISSILFLALFKQVFHKVDQDIWIANLVDHISKDIM